MVEQQDIEFLQAFWTRRAVIAYSVFALNIIIFVLMAFAGGSYNDQTLMAFGAKANNQIDNGEIWRFITPIFIHIGILHLAFNSYALWVIGPHVEKLYGGPRFLLLYLLTGIGGVGASYWYHPFDVSAGASGAIFGMLGVLLVFSIRYRRSVPAFFSRALGKGILLTVGINLVIGMAIPYVDNSAHVGGLITGGLLAFIVPFARPGETERSIFKVIQAVLVIAVAVSFFQVATHYAGPGLSVRNLVRGSRESSGGVGASPEFFKYSFTAAQQVFEDAEAALAANDVRRFEDASLDLKEAITLMERMPPISVQADLLNADLIALLKEEYDYVQEVQREGQQRKDFIGASPQSRRYERLKGRFEAWVESENAKYNFEAPK